MKEKLKDEARRCSGFNNEKWGSISGALLGTGMGIYMLVQHQEIIPVADAFVKIAIEVTTIPLAAGFGALLLSSFGKAIDAITHDNTAINAIMRCRRAYKESRPEFLFFRNGERFVNSYGNSRDAQELTLRHVDSSSEGGMSLPGSERHTPRDVFIQAGEPQEVTPLMQRAALRQQIDMAIQATIGLEQPARSLSSERRAQSMK